MRVGHPKTTRRRILKINLILPNPDRVQVQRQLDHGVVEELTFQRLPDSGPGILMYTRAGYWRQTNDLVTAIAEPR